MFRGQRRMASVESLYRGAPTSSAARRDGRQPLLHRKKKENGALRPARSLGQAGLSRFPSGFWH